MLSEVASNVAGTPCDCRACWYPRVYWLIGPLSNVSDTVVCTAAWADGMATDTPPMSRLRQTTIRATRVATEPGPPRNRTVRRLNGLKGASPQETETINGQAERGQADQGISRRRNSPRTDPKTDSTAATLGALASANHLQMRYVLRTLAVSWS